jgi:ornithine decarboxylase
MVFDKWPTRASSSRWSTWAAASRRSYLKDVPAAEAYGRAIFDALRKHFGNRIPETIIEPGRGMVGNAGVIKAEVVLISRSPTNDDVRWVYLDIGKFGGLAETMDEAIRYSIVTPRDGDEWSPACSPARPATAPT